MDCLVFAARHANRSEKETKPLLVSFMTQGLLLLYGQFSSSMPLTQAHLGLSRCRQSASLGGNGCLLRRALLHYSRNRKQRRGRSFPTAPGSVKVESKGRSASKEVATEQSKSVLGYRGCQPCMRTAATSTPLFWNVLRGVLFLTPRARYVSTDHRELVEELSPVRRGSFFNREERTHSQTARVVRENLPFEVTRRQATPEHLVHLACFHHCKISKKAGCRAFRMTDCRPARTSHARRAKAPAFCCVGRHHVEARPLTVTVGLERFVGIS